MTARAAAGSLEAPRVQSSPQTPRADRSERSVRVMFRAVVRHATRDAGDSGAVVHRERER